jgi:hypothetical protein
MRHRTALANSTAVPYLNEPSTRTRISMCTAVARLGGVSLTVGGHELQLGRGESIEDTADGVGAELRRMGVGTAAELASMPRAEFMQVLGEHGVPVIDYGVAEASSRARDADSAVADPQPSRPPIPLQPPHPRLARTLLPRNRGLDVISRSLPAHRHHRHARPSPVLSCPTSPGDRRFPAPAHETKRGPRHRPRPRSPTSRTSTSTSTASPETRSRDPKPASCAASSRSCSRTRARPSSPTRPRARPRRPSRSPIGPSGSASSCAPATCTSPGTPSPGPCASSPSRCCPASSRPRSPRTS